VPGRTACQKQGRQHDGRIGEKGGDGYLDALARAMGQGLGQHQGQQRSGGKGCRKPQGGGGECGGGGAGNHRGC